MLTVCDECFCRIEETPAAFRDAIEEAKEPASESGQPIRRYRDELLEPRLPRSVT